MVASAVIALGLRCTVQTTGLGQGEIAGQIARHAGLPFMNITERGLDRGDAGEISSTAPSPRSAGPTASFTFRGMRCSTCRAPRLWTRTAGSWA